MDFSIFYFFVLASLIIGLYPINVDIAHVKVSFSLCSPFILYLFLA